MCYSFSKTSVKRMEGVHPELITIFTESIKNSPIDFGIPPHGGLRTAQEQRELFDKGRSKCDGLHKKSRHQSGKALDFFSYVNGEVSWFDLHMAMVASVIMSTAKRLKKEGRVTHDVIWGGTFNSKTFEGWDKPHIELV